MKAVLTIMRGNLRKGKGAFISVLILMFVLSLTLTAVFTADINASNRDQQALKEAGFGDLYVAVTNLDVEKTGITVNDIYQKIQKADVAEKVNKYDCAFLQFKNLNGKSSSSAITALQYDPACYNYKIYKGEGEGVYQERPVLNDGEICAPISYQAMYNTKIGDVMTIITDHGDEEFKIAYYFEDPFMGGSVMGVKTVLFTKNDVTRLMDEGYQTGLAEGKSKIQKGEIFDVFKSESAPKSSLKFVQELNSESGINDYAWISMGTEQSTVYMLLLVRIFCGILIGFVIILLIITLIIIGHSISSSIEQEYVNLGVLKAIGVSKGMLKTVLILQYGLAAFVGAVLGMPVSIPIVSFVNALIRPITCLNVSNMIAFGPCIGTLFVILLLIILYTMLKVRKISSIKPVRALAGGNDDVYFSSKAQMKIRKKGLNFWLAFRQLTSNAKQYIGAVCITMLLVFFLIMVSGMCQWMGPNGSNLVGLFNCYDCDLEVRYHDENLKEDIEKRITDETVVVNHYHGTSEYLNLNDCQIYCFIYDNPDGYMSVQEGRRCEYDNEILVTKFIAKDLNLKIGDTVKVTMKDKSADYIISGFYQSSNDMGSNFSMLTTGYKRLTGEEINETDLYTLADASKATQIADALKKDYSRDRISCSAGNYDDIVDPIVSATQGITVIIYVLTIIFVIVIVIMLCSKMFLKEKINIGIYKAEGFSTLKLRHQFALRFVIVAAIGSILGIFLVLALSGRVMGLIFNFVGISDVDSSISLMMYIVPIIFMLILFYIFAFLIAGKIKHVQTRVLISD